MPNIPGYTDYILEQLERVAPVTSRRMFGALAVYSDGYFFAYVDDDTLFFKVDQSNRQAYVDAGMSSFKAERGWTGYYQVPADVLEDERRLREWMRASLEVARTATSKKK